MNTQLIEISSLPLIKDAETFFSTDKICSIDVVDLSNGPSLLKLKIEIKGNTFRHDGKLYMPLILVGSPENLILKVTKGIRWDILEGYSTWVVFDGNLNDALEKNKIYNLTGFYKNKNVQFSLDTNILIERYILPYIPGDKKISSRPGNSQIFNVVTV